MANRTVEFRWHGRGGQGAKTACMFLAEAAFNSGMDVQGFPEYGPERMGAPITAYNRIAEEHCRVHSNIYYPDYVIVVDETLLHTVEVAKGLKEDGALIVNTDKAAEEIRPLLLGGYKGKIVTVNAKRISEAALGRYFPNTPMLAAAVKVSGVIPQERFIKDMEESYRHKFARKPAVVEGNMKALKATLEEVEA